MFDLKISYYNLNQLLMRYLEFNKVELTSQIIIKKELHHE